MVNIVTGVIGLAGVLIYLGYYFIVLTFVPLAFIIVGVLGMAIGDFVLSLRKTNGNNSST